MTRRSMSPTRKARIFAAADGICHICDGKIDGVRETWDAEHVIPLAAGGTDDDENIRPAHTKCHAGKTATDAGVIAKTKRVARKHQGARKRSRFATSRDGKFKAKVGGGIVRRGSE